MITTDGVARLAYVRVWKFRPQEGRRQDFVVAYGANGPWSKLFSKACGYRGTTLACPSEPGGWWMTIDRWDSRADYEAFQSDFGERYRSLDVALGTIAGEEEFVGEFHEMMRDKNADD